jgi:very-short-patch-repair endonuclease
MHLHRRDLRTRGGIRLTSPARTIADLAAELRLADVERLAAEAQRRGLATRRELEDQLGRCERVPGAPALRSVLGQDRGPAFTRSEAERRLLRLVRAAALPAPLTNARRHGYELDFLWPEQRVVAEVDGLRFHGDLRAQRADRRRDAELVALGYVVLRFTWDRLKGEPEVVVAQLAAALARPPRQ